MLLFIQMKLIVRMNLIDDIRLINKLIANKLILNLFSYLFDLHQTL